VFILLAFQKGRRGSFGLPPAIAIHGGNFHARRRFAVFRKLLEFTGVDLSRLEFSWVSAAEGGKWVEVVTEFTEKVRSMGPLTQFSQLEAEEHWSGVLDTPELKEAYNNI